VKKTDLVVRDAVAESDVEPRYRSRQSAEWPQLDHRVRMGRKRDGSESVSESQSSEEHLVFDPSFLQFPASPPSDSGSEKGSKRGSSHSDISDEDEDPDDRAFRKFKFRQTHGAVTHSWKREVDNEPYDVGEWSPGKGRVRDSLTAKGLNDDEKKEWTADANVPAVDGRKSGKHDHAKSRVYKK
jgi:hypothetical protein